MSNIRPYVIINGVDSRTIQGLLITSLPPISKPAQRTLTETIDGRDGDSSIKLGFSAYDKPLGIALTFGYNVDDVISFFNSEGTIIFSNEPDKLYNFEIFEAIDFEKLIRFKTATVTIHTQPFKFSTTENPLEFTEKEFTVVNNGNTDSRPNLVITGEGLATMQINGKNALNIDFGDAEQTLLIDSEGMNAYYTNNIKSIEAEIVPKQDLHGFDSPFIDSDVVNKVPYLSRALAGTAERIGNYEFNKIIGGTVAFNQLSTAHDTTFTATPTISEGGMYYANAGSVISNGNAIRDHIYLVSGEVKNASANFAKAMLFCGTASSVTVLPNSRNEMIKKSNNVSLNILRIYGTASIETSADFTVNVIDLTQMLGATIADYIYSLEQAQAGAGVAYFKALGFNKDYYPYNAGELMSVKASAHVTKNAGGAVIQTVALDPNLELRGIPKLDANNKLYYDGDTYSADGSVSRRYGVVDLGSLTWTYGNGYFRTGYFATIAKLPVNNSTAINALCIPYVARTWSAVGDLDKEYAVNSANGELIIKDSAYTDVTAFKASLSGVYLVYEKAEATAETAQAFNNPIAIDANGSEEFTDSRAVAIPVGHESFYANICDIEGFTEVNLVRAGVNLNSGLEQITIEASQTSISPTITREFLKAGFTYIISCYQENAMQSNTRNTLRLNKVGDPNTTYYENTLPNYHLAKGLHTLTVTIQSTGFYDVVFWGHSLSNTTVYSNIQIELGSQATDFSAYAGEIFKAEFEQAGEPVTVYGGKYNFTTGLLEITRAVKVYEGASSEAWSDYNSNYDGFSIQVADMNVDSLNPATQLDANIMPVNEVRGASGSGIRIKTWSSTGDNKAFFVCGTGETTTAGLKTWLSNNNLQLCYELAEHIFIELDEQIISALLGINNFYADTGNVTVIFVNDGQDETQTGAIVTFDLDESDLNKGDLANRLVSGNYANIRLKTGSNAIKFIGSVSAVGLDKYSRWL